MVQAGQAASVRLVLRNVSKRAVKVSAGVLDAEATVKAADGTTDDSSAYLEGLPGIPPPLPASRSVAERPSGSARS